MILELSVIAVCAILSALVMRRRDKRHEHTPRAVKLLQPTTYQPPVEVRNDTAYRRDLTRTSPHPIGGFGQCYSCDDSWHSCAAHRGRREGACCTACYHEVRPRPTRVPGPGVPRSG